MKSHLLRCRGFKSHSQKPKIIPETKKQGECVFNFSLFLMLVVDKESWNLFATHRKENAAVLVSGELETFLKCPLAACECLQGEYVNFILKLARGSNFLSINNILDTNIPSALQLNLLWSC